MPLYPGATLFPGIGVFPNTAQVVHGTFIGPFIEVPFRMVATRALYASYKQGLAVWRIDGVWHQGFAPTAAEVAAADRLYEGGRAYPLDLDQIAELTAAGYGAYIQEDS